MITRNRKRGVPKANRSPNSGAFHTRFRSVTAACREQQPALEAFINDAVESAQSRVISEAKFDQLEATLMSTLHSRRGS